MILATQTLKGKTKYIDAFSGREVHLDRMIGSGYSRLPDYAFRYLKPQPGRSQLVSPLTETSPSPRSLRRNRLETAAQKEKINLKVNFSWFKKLVSWIRRRFA
ncbi:hypothetical protein ACRTDU_03940 [Sunxiuqinia elliptica]